MSDIEYVIFDVETTGMDPKAGHAIVELAAEKLKQNKVVDSFDTIVNPNRRVEAEAVAIHGITNEMILNQGKPLIEVIPAFMLFASGATLVAHNAKFDLSFINKHLSDLGLPPLSNPVLDTLDLAKAKVMIGSYNLGYLAKHFSISQPTAHRALADVQVTRELLLKLLALPDRN
ncbi:3'-5' exonuclease [Patescibacteria group bacterium]|nr:3'-5' exonuclease [Patescibacteria group bacterium]